MKIIGMLDKGERSEEAAYSLPQTEEEVLNYLDLASLENQPTEVLV